MRHALDKPHAFTLDNPTLPPSTCKKKSVQQRWSSFSGKNWRLVALRPHNRSGHLSHMRGRWKGAQAWPSAVCFGALIRHALFDFSKA